MELYKILFGISLFLFIAVSSFLIYLVNKNKKSRGVILNENQKLKKIIKDMSLPIYTGSRCIIYGKRLTRGGDNFKVTFEVEILDLTNTKAKVKVTDCICRNPIYIKNNLKNSVMSYMDNTWIDIKDLDIIKGKGFSRNSKIEAIFKDQP